MSEVTIKNIDGEVFVIDDFYTISIHLGQDNIEIPVVWKINDEKVIDSKIIDIALNKIVRDENNPNSEGGWNGTVKFHYFVDKQVSFFHDVTDNPEYLQQGLRNYYEVEFYLAYIPMMNEQNILFNDTMESIFELMENAKEEEQEKTKQHNPKLCIHSVCEFGKVYCEHLTYNVTEKDCYNCEKFIMKESTDGKA